MQSDLQLKTTIVKHHQQCERTKLLRQERVQHANQIRTALLNHKQCVIPITFDPGGQLGPLTTHLLWHRSHRPNTALIATKPLAQVADTQPSLRQAISFTETVAPQLYLLRRADQGWRRDSFGTPFTDHYSAPTPSAWATQMLGHNLVYATAHHISTAISKINNLARLQYRPLSLQTASTLTRTPRTSARNASPFYTPY